MGQFFIEYDFPESGGSVEMLLSRCFDYLLADGSKLRVLLQPAWCSDCGQFVVAEKIPSVEELEKKIAWFQSDDADTVQKRNFLFRDDAQIVEEIAKLRRRIEWRKKRRGPPHCLECGMVDPIPTPIEGEFTHPGTGERVVSEKIGFASLMTPLIAEFSPEGERIV